MTSYFEKLKNPLWQKKRLEVFEKDGWKCSSCGADNKTLVAHHRFYICGREPWEYKTEDLSTLCQECHEIWHAEMDEYKPTLMEVVGRMAKTPSAIYSLSRFLFFHGPFNEEDVVRWSQVLSEKDERGE